uniref:Gnk2-homologous domain-containing protein n=1 Tax=Kalanchoe fedtschenkoi TaxID=63787 RepID=A0A7N0SWC8_KALFE
MGSFQLLVVLLVAALVNLRCPVLLLPASAQSLTDMYYKCSRNRNYTTGSLFESNLSNMLFSIVSGNEVSSGFYNVSEGSGGDRVYSVALCRGDLRQDYCRSCVNASSHEIMDLCLNQKEAIMWSNDCMLRYSDQSLFGVLDFRYSY